MDKIKIFSIIVLFIILFGCTEQKTADCKFMVTDTITEIVNHALEGYIIGSMFKMPLIGTYAGAQNMDTVIKVRERYYLVYEKDTVEVLYYTYKTAKTKK